MPDLTTIFFDWGGVIADDPGDDFLAVVLKGCGASELQVADIFDSYLKSFMTGQLSEAAFWDKLSVKYGLRIHDSISDEFKKWRGLVKNDDVLALVDVAKARGINTALLSNVIEPTYNVLQKAGYYERFDSIIASCKVGFAKPQEEIYQMALRQLHTTAQQSLFVDDKQSNLDPADKLGFHTILAQSPDQIIHDVTVYLKA